ncbi:MAG: family 43 glycosylhydrolase [Chlorobia bacterium]|nr:family 43 glycosylhydrolase [Fimbriimonadaceae bacterium]
MPMTMLVLGTILLLGQTKPQTFCNPINIDYGYCPIPNFVEQGKHRATADPVIVLFKGTYYLFSTNQWGYWWSEDMSDWNFVPRKFLKPWHKVYDELCAPAVWVMDDALYVIGSTHSKTFPIWKSTNPKVDDWKEAVPEFQGAAWDPAFFLDDDGKLYLYYGSSNLYPIYGWEVDRKTLQPIGERQELIGLRDDLNGWERFGEANDNTFLRPFMEGAWVTKHDGKYYLQYGAPGTEFSGYGDGVYTSDKPLGPWTYQPHNPFSYKPGGFARGAGHGATFQDTFDNYWHVSTISISVKNNFERRNGIWPAGFDRDGVMYCDTAYGDYPTFLPAKKNANHMGGMFTKWMLLNYAKPVQASSTLGAFSANFAVDEDIKTYWSAKSGSPGEWFQTDLGEVSTVRAIQINYADQDAEVLGKVDGLYHQYRLLASTDGATWKVIVDKSQNRKDVPHDYVELAQPIMARYLKLENLHVPTGKFALSGLRVFGAGNGPKPESVQKFVVLRGDRTDKRNAWLKWQAVPSATGYVVCCGVAPDKMYSSYMVMNATELYYRAMTRDRAYYFQIEAFNENGISARTEPVKVE